MGGWLGREEVRMMGGMGVYAWEGCLRLGGLQGPGRVGARWMWANQMAGRFR